MANRVIYTKPYDAEIEYLESNGTKYINIGIIPKSKYRAICTYQTKYNPTSNLYALFGSRTNYEANDKFCVFVPKNSTDTSYYVQYADVRNYLSIEQNANDIHTVELGEDSYLDGVLIQSIQKLFKGRYKISLFAINNSNNFTDRRFIGKIFSFKLYNELNVLIFDAIPVRKGSIGYLYDKVSKKLFANKGTGNFTLGPDVANPVPNIRRVFRFGNKRFVMPMPYDKRIEYLESTGTQWINTDTIVNSLDSISVTLQFTQPNAPACIWNARNVNPIKNTISLFRMENDSLRFDYGKTQVSKNASVTDYSIKHEYKSVANTLYVDGISNATNTANSFTAGKSVRVLASSNSNNASIITNFAYAKLYSVKIINSNNEILRDLIPVRRGNIGYLYDKISGKLFGNAGTGQFILGNDIN